MIPAPVLQHPGTIDAYIRHGWSLTPIPPGSKGPKTQGWNVKTNALRSQADLPMGWGIGLCHAYSGTMALDIDQWDKAHELLHPHGIDLNALYHAPDAVIIASGRPGRGKLIYTMPFGLALPSKKISADRQAIYELRCATADGLTVQDVLPPSIHPMTQQPYQWAGGGNWTRVPPIPEPLLALWQGMLEKDKTSNITTDTPVNTSWDEIRAALYTISPDCSRDEWVTCGMALHYAGTQVNELEQGLYLWDLWSQGSPKYPGERDMVYQWSSFKSDKAAVIKLGSLFHLAKQNGWVRPLPDVTALFGSVTPTEPRKIMLRMRPPPPTVPVDLFPPVLVQRASEVSDTMGVDPVIPLFAGLLAVCGAVDARTRLEITHGWKVPPVLWVCTIGKPGDKKTPASSPMFKVLTELERQDTKFHAQRRLEYEVKLAVFESGKKAHIEWAKSEAGLMGNTVGPAIPTEPVEPHKLRVVVSDTSSQQLVRLASSNPRGMLAYFDEMSSWANKITNRASGEDRSSWTVSYESNRYTMDRVGAGFIEVDNYALSIYGNMQPGVWAQYYESLSPDGLLHRFIPVPVDADKAHPGNPVPSFMTNEAAYDTLVRAVFGLPAMTYRLHPDAYTVFREFQFWYTQKMRDERLLGSSNGLQTAMGKLEGLVGRIALVWHIIEAPYSLEVSGALMQRVVALAKHYIIPALRYCHDGALMGRSSFDEWVAEYIIQYADKPSISMNQLRRAARFQIEKYHKQVQIDMVLSAMHPLEQAGWVMRMDNSIGTRDADVVWVINTGIATMFSDHRQEVIEAKQRRMDEIYEDNPKDTVHYVYGSNTSRHA